jgi:ABC-type branched-subunit amino acid transport system ATPase component
MLLEAHGLRKRFGGIWALRDVDVVQAEGETLGMIGPNGSGKTSFVNAMSGALRLDGGTVRFNGNNITGAPLNRIARHGLVRTYQAVRVFPKLSVAENLRVARLVAQESDGRDGLTDNLRMLLRLDTHSSAVAGSLTLFEQRRLELAMRLTLGPRLLMLDEPVGGLAPIEIREMIELLGELRRTCALFVIEHTMKVINELADRVVVLVAGEKIADGPPAQILKDARVVANYLGSAGRA